MLKHLDIAQAYSTLSRIHGLFVPLPLPIKFHDLVKCLTLLYTYPNYFCCFLQTAKSLSDLKDWGQRSVSRYIITQVKLSRKLFQLDLAQLTYYELLNLSSKIQYEHEWQANEHIHQTSIVLSVSSRFSDIFHYENGNWYQKANDKKKECSL